MRLRRFSVRVGRAPVHGSLSHTRLISLASSSCAALRAHCTAQLVVSQPPMIKVLQSSGFSRSLNFPESSKPSITVKVKGAALDPPRHRRRACGKPSCTGRRRPGT